MKKISVFPYVKQSLGHLNILYFSCLMLLMLVGVHAKASQCSPTPISGYQVFNVGGNQTGTSRAFIDTDETFDFRVSVDGGSAQLVSEEILEVNEENFNDLIDMINADLSGAIAAMVDGNVRISSNTTGPSSSIVMSAFGDIDGDLRDILVGYQGVESPVQGHDGQDCTVTELHEQGFESGLGSWQNTGAYDWSLRSGGTPSSSTGPNSAAAGTQYLYMETSGGHAYSNGNTAQIESPTISDASELTFKYHMYGSNMGSLYVDVYHQGAWVTNIWSRTGQQHTSSSSAWASTTVSLSAYTGDIKFRFRGVAAGSYRGDMAIDDIHINNIVVTDSGSNNSGSDYDTNAVTTINTPPEPDLTMPSVSEIDIDKTLSLGGEFDVSAGGQAIYTIPIVEAAGTNGLKPNIQLVYNSGASNGSIGWGWSISGLGSITRCRQTEGNDKNITAITWTEEDRFCLNGERLMLASGNYGHPDSTYRTEIEKFLRVSALGGTPGTPDYFKVEYKDGRIDYFGSNDQGTSGEDNAKHRMTDNTKVSGWLISRRTDSTEYSPGVGNAIRYFYNNAGDGHIPGIKNIIFGGNDVNKGGRGGELIFEWESRQDKTRGFMGGYEYFSESRLKAIESQHFENEIRYYKFHYQDESEQGAHDRVSRLGSITHCANQQTNLNCGQPAHFLWTIPTTGPLYDHTNTANVSGLLASPQELLMADLNGDGLMDIIWSDGLIKHALASLDEEGKLQYTTIPTTGGDIWYDGGGATMSSGLWVIDYNADGRDDLVVKQWNLNGTLGEVFEHGIRVYLAEPNSDGSWALSATPVVKDFIDMKEFGRPFFVDVNGDGLQDIVEARSGKVAIHQIDSNGNYHSIRDIEFTHPEDMYLCNNVYQSFEIHNSTGDFNGDGGVDFIVAAELCDGQQEYYQTHVYTSHPTADGGVELRYFDTLYDFVDKTVRNADNNRLFAYLRVVDFNQDGLSDVINGPQDFNYKLSTGTGFGAEQPVSLEGIYLTLNGSIQKPLMEWTSFVDMNGDGYPDMASYFHDKNVGSNIYGDNGGKGTFWTIVRYWDPLENTFSEEVSKFDAPFYLFGLQGINFRFADMNGNGFNDFIAQNEFVAEHLGQYSVMVATRKTADILHPFRNKIHSISNNGEIVGIDYQNLGQSDHYSSIKNVSSNQNDRNETVCQETAKGEVCWNREIAAESHEALEEQLINPFNHWGYAPQTMQIPPFGKLFNQKSSRPIVTGVSRSGLPISNYYYEHGLSQSAGYGNLGFKRVVKVDRKNGVRTDTEYRQDWPLQGKPLKVTVHAPESQKKISESKYTWAFAECIDSSGNSIGSCVSDKATQILEQGLASVDPIKPFLLAREQTKWDPLTVDDVRAQINESFLQDDKGNIIFEQFETWSGEEADETDVHIKTTNYNFQYSGSSWSMQQGRLQDMTSVSENALGSITRHSSFTYYTSGPEIGLIKSETLEPDEDDYYLNTSHIYDDFGNRVQSIISSEDGTRYGPRKVYDSTGRYVDEIYERFGQQGNSAEFLVSRVASRDHYANPTSTRLYLNDNDYRTKYLRTTTMGVPYGSYDDTGAWTVTDTGLGLDYSGICEEPLTYSFKHVESAGGAESVLCFDRRLRNIRAATKLMDGNWSLVDSEYDILDRPVKVSEPYIEGHTPYWAEYKDYDVLDRPHRIEHPETGAFTEFEYPINTKVTTNAKGQTQRIYKNALDQVLQTRDPLNGDTFFTYDARGNLKTMTDPAGNTTTIDYDLLDRKIAMSDPSKGDWSYKYNHFGEIFCQTDAKNQHIITLYDFNGRLLNRKDYSAGGTCLSPSGSLHSNTTWVYDSAEFGMGQLEKVSDSVSGYEKQITYGAMGRVSESRTRIAGKDNQLENHYEKLTYDQHSRIFQTFDAARSSQNFTRNGVQHLYQNGFLHKLIDAEHIGGETRKEYYEAQEIDQYGNVTKAVYGNGVMSRADYNTQSGRAERIRAISGMYTIQDLDLEWDLVGNVISRHETGTGSGFSPRNLREDFTVYDELNRLRRHQLSGDSSGTWLMSYDSTGSFSNKRKLGGDSMDYYYGQDCPGGYAAGPHQVCDVLVENSEGDSEGYHLYTYDTNGNQTSYQTNTGNRNIQYTVFDKPSRIEKSNHRTEFSYGPDRSRYKRLDTDLSAGESTTTLYLGGVEKLYQPNGDIEWKRSFGGVALITQEVSAEGDIQSQKDFYFHKDHLGSINLISNAAGDVVQVMDFDPWGKRRNIQSWQALEQSLKIDEFGIFNKPLTSRGFTGHEALDEVGLIHMNGRIYDDFLSVFVQADPIIQDPYKSQSLNRYSYLWNNPLNATDPTGFVGEGKNTSDPTIRAREYFANLMKVSSMMKDPNVGVSINGVSQNSMDNSMFGHHMDIIGMYSGTGATGEKSDLPDGTYAVIVKLSNGQSIPGTITYKDGKITSASLMTKDGKYKEVYNAKQDSRSNPAGKSDDQDAKDREDTGTGGGDCSNNPINIATGEKYLTMVDYEDAKGLLFERYYNSYNENEASLGAAWSHNFEKHLEIKQGHDGEILEVISRRHKGDKLLFKTEGDNSAKKIWKADGANFETLEQTAQGWNLHLSDNTIESYNTEGKLIQVRELGGYTQTLSYHKQSDYKGRLKSVSDSYGQEIVFSYNLDSTLKAITLPDNTVVDFKYDVRKRLSKVISPDETADNKWDKPYKVYHYSDKRFHKAITSITNHLGEKIHSMAYDSKGRAIRSALGDEGERVNIAFEDNIKGKYTDKTFSQEINKVATLKNSLGRKTTYFFDKNNKPLHVEGHATESCIAANQGYSYNDQGLIASKLDWNESETRFEYNERGLETLRVEAYGTEEERRIETEWHAEFRLPGKVIETGRTIFYEYNDLGLVVAKTERDTTQKRTWRQILSGKHSERSWSYQYNDQGLLASVDGPRLQVEDITHYEYDEAGNLTASTNALGQRTEILEYNERGLPLLAKDANGVQTRLDYNERGWLTEKTVLADASRNIPQETTTYRYKGVSDYQGQGLVETIIMHGGEQIHYEYDTARRLIAQENNHGERIEYELDYEGNRKEERVYSESGDIVSLQSKVFDELSRVLKVVGADNNAISFEYDKAGNRKSAVDALNNKKTYAYDALNRLVATHDTSGVVEQSYNAFNQLTSVKDQRGLLTRYDYNGFGQKIAQHSPDTGTTVFEYDLAGNLIRKQDAREEQTEFTYDVLNRVTNVIYPGNQAENIHYVYDQALIEGEQFALGRLSQTNDASGSTSYAYNHRGQLLAQKAIVAGQEYLTAYAYDDQGRLASMTYPSGRVVNYERGMDNNLDRINTEFNGDSQLLASEFSALPFGPLRSFKYGNNAALDYVRDQGYRITDIRVSNSAANDPIYDVGFLYDDVGNITDINDHRNARNSQSFEYDNTYRLTKAEGAYGAISYEYDGVGNRLSREVNDTLEEYEYAQDSNRLLSVTTAGSDGNIDNRSLAYDAVGNIVSDASAEKQRELVYGVSNRLNVVEVDEKGIRAHYQYNAKGQRVVKKVGEGETSTETVFHYDAANRLIAETNAKGEVLREFIYGVNQRLAMVDYSQENSSESQSESNLLFVINDHLGTPQLLMDVEQEVVWTANASPFGEVALADSGVKQPLRFPGQYADDETGYSYNYFRDYDPSLGRYIQSDPIGLGGGVNTFGYVGGNPLYFIDKFGLSTVAPFFSSNFLVPRWIPIQLRPVQEIMINGQRYYVIRQRPNSSESLAAQQSRQTRLSQWARGGNGKPETRAPKQNHKKPGEGVDPSDLINALKTSLDHLHQGGIIGSFPAVVPVDNTPVDPFRNSDLIRYQDVTEDMIGEGKC